MYFVVCKMKYIFDSESISDVSFIDKHKKVQYINKESTAFLYQEEKAMCVDPKQVK